MEDSRWFSKNNLKKGPKQEKLQQRFEVQTESKVIQVKGDWDVLKGLKSEGALLGMIHLFPSSLCSALNGNGEGQG